MVVAAQTVGINGPGVRLEGILQTPPRARGPVIFANGSGSSRHSPRNALVAEVLGEAGLATLRLDLLTADEEIDSRIVFDLERLAERLNCASAWAGADPELEDLTVGLFGASTGAGAALMAAARDPGRIGAVVSRGGRPDLARAELSRVLAPTLLIVGGEDHEVLELNRMAFERLSCHARLEVVPGATHLFPEPGAMEEVARLARDWFVRHLNGGEAGDHGVGILEG